MFLLFPFFSFFKSKTLVNVIPEMNRWDLQNKMLALGTQRHHRGMACAISVADSPRGCWQVPGDGGAAGPVPSKPDLGSDSTHTHKSNSQFEG